MPPRAESMVAERAATSSALPRSMTSTVNPAPDGEISAGTPDPTDAAGLSRSGRLERAVVSGQRAAVGGLRWGTIWLRLIWSRGGCPGDGGRRLRTGRY